MPSVQDYARYFAGHVTADALQRRGAPSTASARPTSTGASHVRNASRHLPAAAAPATGPQIPTRRDVHDSDRLVRDGIARDGIARDGIARDTIRRDVQRDVLTRDVLSRDVLSRDVLSRDVLSRDVLDRDVLERDLQARRLAELNTQPAWEPSYDAYDPVRDAPSYDAYSVRSWDG